MALSCALTYCFIGGNAWSLSVFFEVLFEFVNVNPQSHIEFEHSQTVMVLSLECAGDHEHKFLREYRDSLSKDQFSESSRARKFHIFNCDSLSSLDRHLLVR